MKATVYETLSNEKKPVIVQAGKTLRESLKEYSLEDAVIIVNGKVKDAGYVMKENDVAMIRLLPGALTTSAIIGLVIFTTLTVVAFGATAGAILYNKLEDKNQRELEKLKKQMNRPEVDNRPFLRGASNTVAAGNSQPYIIGRHLFTPYLLCSPFYRITGEDGKDQYTYTVLECGFNRQVIDTVSVDDIEIKKFTDTSPQQGAYDIESGVFAEEGKLEISQNGALLSEIPELNYKVISKTCNQEIPRESEVQSGDKEYLTYTLSPNAMNVDVAVTFPYGLYANSDDGSQIETQVTVTPEYSLDGGQTYTAFTFDNNGSATNTFRRNVSSKELRYVAHADFTAAQYNTLKANGQNAIWLRIRSSGNKDTRIHNDCYCLFYQSKCYDAEKSINQNGSYTSLVPCLVLEDRERSFCTVMGLKVKATKINEEKLTKINIITQGVARIWNGSRWSSAKTATSNPAAWALEILTSDSHPASRYSDDELDTESFGEFYEYCEDNGFSFDWVITNNQKKSDVLNNILASANACLYFDIYGRLAVSIDRAQENAIAVYNPQNIISIENKKSLTRRTDAIRIKYTNAEDDIFQEDTYLVKREVNGVPVTIDENSIIRDVSVTGITRFSQIVKYARRLMAIEELRPKTTVIKVGNEGIYYTPFSKVLIQDDSLKIGLGKGYVISGCIWNNGTLTHIKTGGKVKFEEGKNYGIIVNCYTEDGVRPVAVKVSGAGETDLLNVLTPIYGGTTDAVPEAGNVFSFGELDESGEFTKVTTEYLISNITRESDGFSLELVNYNEAIYDSGTIPEYVSNITPRVSDTAAEIPQDIVTRAELHEEVANAVGDITLDVEYSADGTTWHETFAAGSDLYMRQSTDGGTTWTDAMRIVGEKGDTGEKGDKGAKGDTGAAGTSWQFNLWHNTDDVTERSFPPEIPNELFKTLIGRDFVISFDAKRYTSYDTNFSRNQIYIYCDLRFTDWDYSTSRPRTYYDRIWDAHLHPLTDEWQRFSFTLRIISTKQLYVNGRLVSFLGGLEQPTTDLTHCYLTFGQYLADGFRIRRLKLEPGTVPTEYCLAEDEYRGQQYQCVYSGNNIYLYGLRGSSYAGNAQPFVQYNSSKFAPPRNNSGYCQGFSNVYATAFLAILRPDTVMPLTWTSGQDYRVGHVVSYTADGVDYGRFICTAAHTASETILPTNTAYWRPANVLEVYFPYHQEGVVWSSLTKTAVKVTANSDAGVANSNFIIVGKIRHTGTADGYVENITPVNGAVMWEKLKSQISFQGIVGEIPANTNYTRYLYRISKDSDVFTLLSSGTRTPDIGTLVFVRGVTGSNYTNTDGTVDTVKGLRLWNGVTWGIVDQANTPTFWETCRNAAMLALVGVAKVYSAHNVPVPDACGAVFDLLIANKAFIEQLSAEQIVFQDYVASSSSKNPSSGDMMIYMGKNPANYTATSEFQFALSKYIGQIGGTQMWSDLLKTKLLPSGLLALMLSGCVQTTDAVYSHAGAVLEKTEYSNVSEIKRLNYLRTYFYDDNYFYIVRMYDDIVRTKDFKQFEICAENLPSISLINPIKFINNHLWIIDENLKLFVADENFSNWTQKGDATEINYWKSKKVVIAINLTTTHYQFKSYDPSTGNLQGGEGLSHGEGVPGTLDMKFNDDVAVCGINLPKIIYAADRLFSDVKEIDNPVYAKTGWLNNKILATKDNKFFVSSSDRSDTKFGWLTYDLNKDKWTFEIAFSLDSYYTLSTAYLSDEGFFFQSNNQIFMYNFKTYELELLYQSDTINSFFKNIDTQLFCSDSGNKKIIKLSEDYKKVEQIQWPSELSSSYSCTLITEWKGFYIFGFGNLNPTNYEIYISCGREAGSGIIAESKGTSQNWVRFSNGFLAQWGIVYKGSTLNHGTSWNPGITLPLAYPDKNYHVMLSAGDQGGGGNEIRETTNQRTNSTIQIEWFNRNSQNNTNNPSVSWLTLGWG